MKKRVVICLACIMTVLLMLCGCDIDDTADFDVADFFFGDKSEETVVEDKLVEETPMPVISINDVGEEKREEVTLPEIKEDGLPKFYISTEHASDYGEDTEWINHRFDQIHMVTDDDSYSEIGKHLDEVNKGITQ
ncbi:MAG: hypothetical protein K6F34_09555, partial [Lachnospiraceae bacterium]|nr:hypothetical protein [Lachnospiraceae bacterium]